MDIGRSITYVFEDPNWLKKVLIGGLLFLIPIFGWAVVGGYWLRTVRRVIAGEASPLPEWSDFGIYFIDGIKLFIVSVVWSIPAWILAGYSSFMSLAASGDNTAGAIAGGGGALGIQCLSSIVSLAVLFLQPLFMSRLAVEGDLAAAFQFGAIFDEARRFAGPLLIVVGMYIALSFLAMFGVILCLVGVLFTGFIAYIMLAHLYGQIRRTAQGQSAVPALY